VDIGGISPVAVLLTSHIDPRLILLENQPNHDETMTLALPSATYESPFPSIRVADITQEMGYLKELGIIKVLIIMNGKEMSR
jgi:hypothetical protein